MVDSSTSHQDRSSEKNPVGRTGSVSWVRGGGGEGVSTNGQSVQ